VDRQLKERAEKVLAQVGISTTDAVTMMLHQIVLRQGLPFDVRVPNCETISAMEGLDAGKGERSTDSTGNVFDKAVRKRNQRWA
jgi:DNA-damage-inducible protein J